MPIENYSGETFVAFTDISGFKAMMKSDKAKNCLIYFYKKGYEILNNQENSIYKVDGFFVSDCGVLFVKENNVENKAVDCLRVLLDVVEKLNREMLKESYMLMTSIAYGHFEYKLMKEHQHTNKNPIYGEGYLDAYLDLENQNEKIKPGQCRLKKSDLIKKIFERNQGFERILPKEHHFYFYWMVNEKSEIEEFELSYRESFAMQYRAIIESLNVKSKTLQLWKKIHNLTSQQQMEVIEFIGNLNK
jgi:hypothetical protein